MGVFGGLRVGSGEILMGLGLRESFEPPLLDPVLVPFSDQDRAKSNPKTELRGHRGAEGRFLQNLHGASAGSTFLPSPGGRQRPKTSIRRALGRLQTVRRVIPEGDPGAGGNLGSAGAAGGVTGTA